MDKTIEFIFCNKCGVEFKTLEQERWHICYDSLERRFKSTEEKLLSIIKPTTE